MRHRPRSAAYVICPGQRHMTRYVLLKIIILREYSTRILHSRLFQAGLYTICSIIGARLFLRRSSTPAELPRIRQDRDTWKVLRFRSHVDDGTVERREDVRVETSSARSRRSPCKDSAGLERSSSRSSER